MDAAVRARFEQLVTGEGAILVRAAERVTGRRESAEDASQEALLFALRQGTRLLEAPQPVRWLRWLATRHACVELRAQRRRRFDEAASFDGAVFDTSAERRDEAARVARAMAELPLEWAEALRLRFELGMTFAAIAARIGVAEATAHARVRRGLEALRARLAPRRGPSAWLIALVRSPWSRSRSAAAIGRSIRAPFSALRWLAPLAGVAGMLVFLGADPDPEAGAERVRDSNRPTTRAVAVGATRVDADAFDIAELAQRVPLSAYLDAGGVLPPQSIHSASPLSIAALRGRAFDAGGSTLAGAVIEVRRAIADTELLLCVTSTTTDESGDFALDEIPAGESFSLIVRWGNAVIEERSLVLEQDERRDLGALVAGVRIDESPGNFVLDATLRDEFGAPLPFEIVVLSRVQIDARGRTCFARESAGRTDCEGRIRLDGHWLGAKRLETPGLDAAHIEDFTLDRSGAHAQTFTPVTELTHRT